MIKQFKFLTSLIFCFFLSGCNKNKVTNDDCRLIEAAHLGDLELLQSELLRGCDPKGNSDHVNEPIYNAIVFGHTEIVKALLDEEIDPNYDWGEEGGDLLTNAVQFERLDIVKLLLEHGANINREIGASALYISIVHKYREIENHLVSHGAKLNENDLKSFEKHPFLDTREHN